MKRLVREHGSPEAKGEEASGSEEWPTGSKIQQYSKLMTTRFDKWSPESSALEYLCTKFSQTRHSYVFNSYLTINMYQAEY